MTTIFVDQQRFLHAIGIVEDIDERNKADQQLRVALLEKEVLLKEIHHRLKNNMQVISSLVALQVNCSEDAVVRALLQETSHRIRSMALVHEKLYQTSDWGRIDFATYARTLLAYLWHANRVD